MSYWKRKVILSLSQAKGIECHDEQRKGETYENKMIKDFFYLECFFHQFLINSINIKENPNSRFIFFLITRKMEQKSFFHDPIGGPDGEWIQSKKVKTWMFPESGIISLNNGSYKQNINLECGWKSDTALIHWKIDI